MVDFRVNKILDILNKKLKSVLDGEELTLTMSDLADSIYCSKRTLERLFRDKLKMPFTKYYQRLRIEYAIHLLITTELSIADIASKIGYTPSSFSREFKSLFPDITPAKLRKERRLTQKRSIREYSYEVTYLPTIHLIYTSHIGNYTELNTESKELELFDSLVEIAKQEGVLVEPVKSYGIAFDDAAIRDDKDCRYYACIEVSKPVILRHKEINILTIPSGKYAKYLHKGSYSELNLLYDDIFYDLLFTPEDTFIWDEKPYIIERYLNDVKDTIEEDLLTEVMFPMK